MNQFTGILIERLEEQGIEPSLIPGFVRSLAGTLLVHPKMNLLQVNKKMQFLGWDYKLDYHTLQLAIACFEAEGLKKTDKGLPTAFKTILNHIMSTMMDVNTPVYSYPPEEKAANFTQATVVIS
ncbi:hypothetical protein ACFL9T_09665 [Thermodesulfobacteriota bacterium]